VPAVALSGRRIRGFLPRSSLARAVLDSMTEENDAMIHIRRWTGLVALSTFVGCAAPPVPAEKLASAEAGIRAAAEVGAEGVPQAALHLKLARDQVDQAKGLVQRGDRDRATVVLDRAEADAALSLALARESAARAEAAAVLAQVQSLRQRSP
jgi:hypothetical protein